jgi:hypothetical protein
MAEGCIVTNFILQENGDKLLAESGDFLIQDRDRLFAASVTATTTATGVFQRGLSLFPTTSAAASASSSFNRILSLLASANIETTATIDVLRLGAVFHAAASAEAVAELLKMNSIPVFNMSATAEASANALEFQRRIGLLCRAHGQATGTVTKFTVIRFEPTYDRRITRIFLAEIEAYDPASSSLITYRFASGQGYDNAGTFYKPRLENPATFSRSMGGGIGGRTSTSLGELTLINIDRELAAMADDYYDGRTLTLKVGDPDSAYSTFTTALKATIETVAVERERISVRLRDKAVALDKPFSDDKFGGTNSLPSGIDGTADDIKDQHKPRILGRIALMQPVLVNTSRLIYMVNAGPVDGILNVFDAGAYLSRGSDYTNQADMEANEPARGQWRACPSIGSFRLGSSPYGELSVSVVEEWDYLSNTAAGLIQRILTEKGYTSSDWVAADFTALNARNAGSLGVVVQGDETTASLIDRICQSVGAWWGFDNINRFRVARFEAPTGSPVATLTDNEILEIERQPEGQLPLWQTTLKADINFAVQDKQGLAGVVPELRAAWLANESRDQKAENADVKTQRLLAEAETYDSALNGISIAQAESARRLALFSQRRDVVNVTLANPADRYSTLDLGAVVLVQSDKLSYGTGRLMVVTSVLADFQSGTLDLTLWG